MIQQNTIKKISELRQEFLDEEITLKGYIKSLKRIIIPHLTEHEKNELNGLDRELVEDEITEKGYVNKNKKILDKCLERLDIKEEEKENNSLSPNIHAGPSSSKAVNGCSEIDEIKNNGSQEIEEINNSENKSIEKIKNKIDEKENKIDESSNCVESFENDSVVESSSLENVSLGTPERKKGIVRGKRRTRSNTKLQPTITSMFMSPGDSLSKSKKKFEEENTNESVKSEEVEEIMEEIEGESPNGKRVKTNNNEEKNQLETTKVATPKTGGIKRCHLCRQILESDDLVLYGGHPEKAVEEFVALLDPKLSLFTGDEEFINEEDQRPQHKLTSFSVYDKEGHLCPFDGGLIESNVLLFLSGYLKPIYDENPLIDDGVPTMDVGPINEWWVSGFDGGENVVVGFSTPYADYILMEPSEAYAPFFEAVKEKIYMSKLMIEFLVNSPEAAYEDLINKLETTVPPAGISAFSEDTLLRHAQFICDQVHTFDLAGSEDDDEPLIATSCMRALIKLAGVTLGKRRAMRQRGDRLKVDKMPKFSKATTTPLVRYLFEYFFADQIAQKESGHAPRRKRCGDCEVCQQPDCGNCRNCLDMVKFGGSGKSKQCCINRRCPNLAIAEADDNDLDEEVDNLPIENLFTKSQKQHRVKQHSFKLSWSSEPIAEEGKKTYYDSVSITGELVKVGDFVAVEPDNPKIPPYIARVMYMWEDNKNNKYFHADWFCRGADTILAETADPKELFLIDDCDDIHLASVLNKVTVIEHNYPEDWDQRGGNDNPDLDYPIPDCDSNTFFYQKWYNPEFARFEDIPVEVQDKDTPEYKRCASCLRIQDVELRELCQLGDKLDKDTSLNQYCYDSVAYRGYVYGVGDCAFVNPGAFKFKSWMRQGCACPVRWLFGMLIRIAGALVIGPASLVARLAEGILVAALAVACWDYISTKFQDDLRPLRRKTYLAKPANTIIEESKKKNVDEELYPEYYRKTSNIVKGSNVNTPEPFRVVRIIKICAKDSDNALPPGDVKIKVAKFYRPEDTHRGRAASYQANLNMLYWSEEETTVNFHNIVGKCWVSFKENIQTSLDEYIESGPYRYFFIQSYNAETKSFEDPPTMALSYGSKSKGKGKGKGKQNQGKKRQPMENFPEIQRKLKTLDVFAGCGGLSLGMHQAGICDAKWAIEVFEPAAQAFRLNNPRATVFTDDCNLLLQMVMEGKSTNAKGQKLPKKGDVELMCGGPPCQGFSGMNRFNSRQYSLFKNSLVSSYLSYCDYYRPKFFLLENVRNFVSYKCSMVLKLTLRVLLRMGYQCTVGVMQAGNYGVPQTRRRTIILAAAPGQKLPFYPEPMTTFSPKSGSLLIAVDNKRYVSNCQWVTSAPFRTITVRDALSDLPEIKNGAKKDQISYGTEPESHFQKLIRGNHYQPLLRDHICKDMAPLVEARMRHIPTAPGSDWRDLPNIAVRLSNGAFSKILRYTHHDKKNGKSSTGSYRGVCSCVTGRPCDPMDRQFNTLIPWCLPHTGNRHNHWSGLYGRLEWDGYFSTTVTNPEPMGKQGRVLHPEQHRVVSVRECARSQGFPDTYRFHGSILEKHRQIGNAVPPPMGKAIGQEIRKCIIFQEKQVLTNGTMPNINGEDNDISSDDKNTNGEVNTQIEFKKTISNDKSGQASSSIEESMEVDDDQ